MQVIRNIALFLLLIKERPNTVPLECAKPVQSCPANAAQWKQKSNLFHCSSNEGYVCLRDPSGYLFESCIANYTIRANSSNCPIIFACRRKKAYLGPVSAYYHCPGTFQGCPPKIHPQYSIHNLYKYPKCIESNLTVTTITSVSATSASTTTVRIDESSPKGTIQAAVIIPLVACTCICVGVVIYCVIKKRRNHDNGSVQCKKDRYHLTDYSTVPSQLEKCHIEGLEELRIFIRSVNNEQADILRISPTKGDTLDIPNFFVHMPIIDEDGNHICTDMDQRKVRYTRIENILCEKPVSKRLQVVYILGEAGYGKSMICERIVKLWCDAYRLEIKENEKLGSSDSDESRFLKRFEFLFFVKMAYLRKDHTSPISMIQEFYGLNSSQKEILKEILEKDLSTNLVVLDAIDEWNVPLSKLKDMLESFRSMPKCTILISMRSWKFMEVKEICRPKFDRVIRLNGLNNDGMKELTTKILRNYTEKNTTDENGKDLQDFESRSKQVHDSMSASPVHLRSFLKIPLLTIYCAIALYEGGEMESSWAFLQSSVIEILLRRYCKTQQSGIEESMQTETESRLSDILRKHPYLANNMSSLSSLGKVAFENLTSGSTSSVIRENKLNEELGKDSVELFLRTGILIKIHTSSRFYKDNIIIRFLHRSVQEFLAALYLFNSGTETEVLKSLTAAVKDINEAFKWSNILIVLSGLSPMIGCEISKHLKNLANKDEDVLSYRSTFHGNTYQKVLHLYGLQLRCYSETRGSKTIAAFTVDRRFKFWFSDIILMANETDELFVRESAKVLQCHANEIKSLSIVCIPDDDMNGITNDEIKAFLDSSSSIESFYIDGYAKGKCRLFRSYSQRMSCLRTLGLANVGFHKNALTDLLRTNESKKGINSLLLLYIKPTEDLSDVNQYHVSSNNLKSASISNCMVPHSYVISTVLPRKRPEIPVLEKIIETLPSYQNLTTLHITYMESKEDRQMLIKVFPELIKLETLSSFSYIGSSQHQNTDDVYDTSIVSNIMKLRQLREISLSLIHLKENIIDIAFNSKIESVVLIKFEMNSPDDWMSLLDSATSNRPVKKVVLCDTNIRREDIDKYCNSPDTQIFVHNQDWIN